MVVGPSGELPLPWLRTALIEALARQRGHALLVQGAPGDGAFEFAFALAQAWLCEAPGETSNEASARPRPCGQCAACKLVQSKTHSDLNLRIPEELAVALEWPVALNEQRKPSRQIRVEEVRKAIEWISSTSARGRAKVLLFFPAEALNPTAANALLKTLEEPPAGARILICAADPARLLPTVRSRCQLLQAPRPTLEQAQAWLQGQGVDQPGVLLAAAGGHPLDALKLQRAGISAQAWAALPGRVAQGDAAALAGWGVAPMLEALLKICHDAMLAAVAAQPVFFPAASIPGGRSLQALKLWHQALQRVARHADHPWQEALLVDALVSQGREALGASVRKPPPLDTLKP